MRTPLGWYRANLMYETSTKPPAYGSHLETLFLLLSKFREERQLMLDRAMFLSQVNPKEAVEAFNSYVGELSFSSLQSEEEMREEKMREALKKWTGRGTVHLPVPKSRRSGLAAKLVKKDE